MDSPIPDSKVMNITLKVKMKPRMVNGARTEHWGVLGEWANLTCAVHAEPPARFEWLHGNRTLVPSDEVSIMNPQENVSILQPMVYKSRLQVLVRNEGKFGQYSCKARNEVGTLVKVMVLLKGQKPSTPVLETDVIAHDGARIRVKELRHPTPDVASGDSLKQTGKSLPIIGYVVQVKMMTRSDWKMANSSMTEGGFVIKGLNAGITYQVRAASKNQASVGEYSQPITVITSRSTTISISGTTANHHVDHHLNSVFAVVLNFIFLSAIARL
jgi:hypothetical protein